MKSPLDKRSLEEKTLLSICAGCIFCVSSFGVMRGIRGEWLVTAMDASLAILMAGLWLFVYRSNKVYVGGLILSIILLIGTNTTIFLQGPSQIYWFFPAMAATYYFTPIRYAIPITILALSAAYWILNDQMDAIQMYTFVFTVVINNAFAYTFVSLTRQQRSQLRDEEQRRTLWLQNLARFLQHELRNTMLGFRSSLDLIDRRNNNVAITPYIERARNSLTYMNILMKNVGDASSLEATLSDGPFEQLDLAVVVRNWLDRHKIEQGFENYELFCYGETTIIGNQQRLQQLLDKLISNARSHAAIGTNVIVTVGVNQQDVVLHISNIGDCLPPDHDKLFTMFVSLRSDADKSEANIGIGLYVAKIIAEAHRGKLIAENRENNDGVIFSLYLPRKKNPR